jgi:PleD family two-component response regulator
LIVDDSLLIRAGVRHLLDAEQGIAVISERENSTPRCAERRLDAPDLPAAPLHAENLQIVRHVGRNPRSGYVYIVYVKAPGSSSNTRSRATAPPSRRPASPA